MNPHDPQMMRIFHERGAFHAVCANNGGGLGAGRSLAICFASVQPHDTTRGYMEESVPTINASAGMSGNVRPFVVCFAQNTRDEVRLIGGDGHVAGALAAEPGMKQQNYIMENANDE